MEGEPYRRKDFKKKIVGCGVHVDPYSNKLLKDGHL